MKMKASWKMVPDCQFDIPDVVRRELVANILDEIDAEWGMPPRPRDEMEAHLDTLFQKDVSNV